MPLQRFIPTLVGNSAIILLQKEMLAVHPHACGELRRYCFTGPDRTGSSPRLWGTLKNSKRKLLEDRFIPTLVGNSTASTSNWKKVTVHPHACGELPTGQTENSFQQGSSPRLWGTQWTLSYLESVLRFIPTLVGNSLP